MTTGGQLVCHRVSLDDVLMWFSTAAARAPGGSFGKALERARDGTSGGTNLAAAQERQESQMLRDAAVIRCIDDLEGFAEFYPRLSAVATIADAASCPQGLVVSHILRRFQPWAHHEVLSGPNMVESNRGFIEVYRWARLYDATMRDIDSGQLHKRWHERPAELVGEAKLAVGQFVSRWSRRAT